MNVRRMCVDVELAQVLAKCTERAERVPSNTFPLVNILHCDRITFASDYKYLNRHTPQANMGKNFRYFCAAHQQIAFTPWPKDITYLSPLVTKSHYKSSHSTAQNVLCLPYLCIRHKDDSVAGGAYGFRVCAPLLNTHRLYGCANRDE